MKIHPRNRRKAKWFPYDPYYENIVDKGWIHFERLDGSLDILTYVPRDYADKITKHFLKTEEILHKEIGHYGGDRFIIEERYFRTILVDMDD